jgi:hypothetical protein
MKGSVLSQPPRLTPRIRSTPYVNVSLSAGDQLAGERGRRHDQLSRRRAAAPPAI